MRCVCWFYIFDSCCRLLFGRYSPILPIGMLQEVPVEAQKHYLTLLEQGLWGIKPR